MGGGKEKWRKWRLFWRRYWQFFSYCECAVVIGVVSSSTCVTILLQVCGNVLLSVIPWWGVQSVIAGIRLNGTHSFSPRGSLCCILQTFCSICISVQLLALQLLPPFPPLPAGAKPLLLWWSFVLYVTLVWARFASPHVSVEDRNKNERRI